MKKEVEKRGYLLTRLDMEVLFLLSDKKLRNMGEVYKGVHSTQNVIKNNLQRLKNYKLIKWKINKAPIPHKILFNENFKKEINGMFRVFGYKKR